MLMFVLLITISGCQQQPQYDADDAIPESSIDLFSPIDGALIRETWDVHTIGKSKVGHRRVRDYQIGEPPNHKIRRLAEDFLHIRRFGQISEQSLKMVSLESSTGEVLQLAYEVESGGQSRRFTGHIRGDQLLLHSSGSGDSKSKTLTWSPDNGGFFAVQNSLTQRPLQPGERRTVSVFLPIVDRVGRLDLVAHDFEDTELLSGRRRLLRVEVHAGDNVNDEIYWIDEHGEIIKFAHNSTIDTTYRADESAAMRPNDTTVIDVALDVRVPLEKPFPAARQMKRAEYRVTLARDKPAELFATSDFQQVIAESDRVARLIVTASNAGRDNLNSRTTSPQPTDSDLLPNHWIQSDDPRVRALAEAAAGSRDDPGEIALALEQYVHRTVRTVDFRQILASAAEVVRQRRGDCSEQAVLLAAACRAREIPARVVVGLVYAPQQTAFLYHMWNEVWTGDRWLPLDATLGQGLVGPDHIKLTDGSLSEKTAYELLSAVNRVVGQLGIELLSTDDGSGLDF